MSSSAAMIDEDSQILRGEFVEMVTTHPQWVQLVEEFELAACQQLLSTKTHEVKRREAVYTQFDGARQFLDFLRSCVRAKYEILEQRAIQQDAPEDDIGTDPDAYRE